jgi:ribosomal protein L11 methyltransferase
VGLWGESNVQSNWVDVRIEADLDAGELLGRLADPAVRGAWEDAGTVHLYWPEDQWNGERLAMVRSAVSQLTSGEIGLSVDRVPSQDWNAQWARSVKPLRIGRLVIRPSWEPVQPAADEIDIVLDPKQAFGTGHHATTRILLEWLQDDIRGGETVLDVGAGSAILAMAAVKLGAASAVGVECDPVAVDCAREYVALNGLSGRVELVCGTMTDLAQGVTADLVMANLDRQTLLMLADDFARYADSGARLMLSGVLVDQEADVVDRYSDLGLARAKRREAEGWVALELVRPESCDGADV